MKISCPKCAAQYMLSDAAVGKQVRCKNPECGQVFTVSPAPQQPAEGEVPVAGPPLPDQRVAQGDGPPAAVPPPVPPLMETPRQPSPEGILAGYKRTSKPPGPGLKERLARGVDALRKRLARVVEAVGARARALKLKHDIKNLQTAIEGQSESLGTLTLQHHPSEVDISSQTAELSQIQENLAQKQATREALRGSKGSGSAIKAVDRELGQLRARQRELMIAIGRKAEAKKTQMPGAAGHYSGLDQLRSLLSTKQSELKSLEERIGPILEGQGPTRAALRRPLMIGGAVLAAVLVLYLVWSLASSRLFAGHLPGWTRYYVPDDAQGLVYINAERLRETGPYADFEDKLRGDWRRVAGDLQIDEVEEVFSVLFKKGGEVTVVRTQEDLSLDDILPKADKHSANSKYRGTEYVRTRGAGMVGSVFVAKTDDFTFCLAESEEALKKALNCWQRREKPVLDQELQRALQYVGRNDLYAVGKAASVDLPIGEAGGLGISVSSSSVKVVGILIMRNERQAERFVRDVEDFFDSVRAMFKGPRSPGREAALDALDVVEEELKFRQKGKTVYLKGSVQNSDIEDLLEQMREINPT